jgi:hypothetical protein
MSSFDFVPRTDADFNIWQTSVISISQTNATAWGIPATEITALTGLQTPWNNTFAKAANKQNRTPADVKAKKDAHDALEKALRKFVAQWLANNTKVPDSERQRMGLTVKSKTRTASAIPTSCPMGSIDFSTRMQHTISFVDENTPHSKAKPEGVHGCEVWVKVGGEAPKDPSEFAYLATDTATPFVTSFNGEHVGKTAWYMLRWVNTRGERGPWSNTISAMVN